MFNTEENPRQLSLIELTGRNALTALGITLFVTLLLTLAYSLLAVFADIVEKHAFDIQIFIAQGWMFFRTIGICAGPILLILAFALLQRFRLKG